MSTPAPPPPPSTLPPRGPGRQLWTAVTKAYVLGAGELQILEAAGIAWEAHQEAAAHLAAEGVVVTSPQGMKANPAVAILDRTGAAVARYLKQLGVSLPEEDVKKIKGGGGRPAVVRLPRAS
jgi:phage terminase small subunit